MFAIHPAWRRAAVALVLGCAAAVAAALEPPQIDAEVRDCLARSVPEKSLFERVAMRVFEGDEQVSDLAADLSWKRMSDGRSRALLRVTDPPHSAGLALLVVEPIAGALDQEMFMYLPELRATRRIVGTALAGSMFGSGFSFEDFALVQRVSVDHATRRLDDEVIGERANYVVEATPAAEGSQYTRIVTFIDQQWCVPVALHFYAANAERVKQVVADPARIEDTDGRWIPRRLTLTDYQRNGRTEVEVLEVVVNPALGDHAFTPSALEQGR